MTDQLLHDLSKHYRDRLLKLTDDLIDTCKRLEYDKEDAACIIMCHNLTLGIVTAISLGADKTEILNVCKEYIGSIQRKARQA